MDLDGDGRVGVAVPARRRCGTASGDPRPPLLFPRSRATLHRMRTFALVTLLVSASAFAQAPADAYVPAPASEIPGYSPTRFPCRTVQGWRTVDGGVQAVDRKHPDNDGDAMTFVVCQGKPDLDALSLRELALLRNTIYARYGWAGFRKRWLREHFEKQPWYRPDPNFTAARLSEVDRQNVQLIAQTELSWRYTDLENARDRLLADADKWWGDLPSYTDADGKRVYACSLDGYTGTHYDDSHRFLPWVSKFNEAAERSKDCRHHRQQLSGRALSREVNTASPPDPDKLGPQDLIELGLLSRAMGEFAVDDGEREQLTTSLDEVLPVKELRQLSLRDLRILRNTIFARRGRPFKSKVLQKHFSQMPWYTADKTYTDARLTANDRRNIDLIRAVEEEFGGPLQDSDFKVANPSDSKDIIPAGYGAA